MTDSSPRTRRSDLSENPAATIQSVCSLGLCRSRKGPLRTAAAGYSDIGSVRESNDDLVFAGNDCRLYVILDGVGGYAGGATASLIVLDKLRSNIEAMCEQHCDEANQGLEEGVRTALKLATNSMLELADDHPEFAKMSTVFALAYIVEGVMLYTHVGDCRVYVVRRGKATQLTTDETFVQLMVDKGEIKPEDVQGHPMKNVILNSVGARSAAYDPIIHSAMLLPGDTVLLTTDGVTDYLNNQELSDLACVIRPPAEKAKSIVQAALDAQSRDNVSCVVVAVDRADDAEPDVRNDLHLELAKLHDLLTDIDAVDDELRKEMAVVADDIRQALGKPNSNELIHLKDQLEDRTIAFEVKYPRISAIVSSISGLLSRMGI